MKTEDTINKIREDVEKSNRTSKDKSKYLDAAHKKIINLLKNNANLSKENYTEFLNILEDALNHKNQKNYLGKISFITTKIKIYSKLINLAENEEDKKNYLDERLKKAADRALEYEGLVATYINEDKNLSKKRKREIEGNEKKLKEADKYSKESLKLLTFYINKIEDINTFVEEDLYRYYVTACENRGSILKDLGRLDEALKLYITAKKANEKIIEFDKKFPGTEAEVKKREEVDEDISAEINALAAIMDIDTSENEEAPNYSKKRKLEEMASNEEEEVIVDGSESEKDAPNIPVIISDEPIDQMELELKTNYKTVINNDGSVKEGYTGVEADIYIGTGKKKKVTFDAKDHTAKPKDFKVSLPIGYGVDEVVARNRQLELIEGEEPKFQIAEHVENSSIIFREMELKKGVEYRLSELGELKKSEQNDPKFIKARQYKNNARFIDYNEKVEAIYNKFSEKYKGEQKDLKKKYKQYVKENFKDGELENKTPEEKSHLKKIIKDKLDRSWVEIVTHPYTGKQVTNPDKLQVFRLISNLMNKVQKQKNRIGLRATQENGLPNNAAFELPYLFSEGQQELKFESIRESHEDERKRVQEKAVNDINKKYQERFDGIMGLLRKEVEGTSIKGLQFNFEEEYMKGELWQLNNIITERIIEANNFEELNRSSDEILDDLDALKVLIAKFRENSHKEGKRIDEALSKQEKEVQADIAKEKEEELEKVLIDITKNIELRIAEAIQIEQKRIETRIREKYNIDSDRNEKEKGR
jgi:hypothetical protein